MSRRKVTIRTEPRRWARRYPDRSEESHQSGDDSEAGVRVSIDRDKCVGYGNCMTVLPDVFELADDGIAYVRVPEVAETLRQRVELAVRLCPAGAVILTDDRPAAPYASDDGRGVENIRSDG